jgi:hypothetical protein
MNDSTSRSHHSAEADRYSRAHKDVRSQPTLVLDRDRRFCNSELCTSHVVTTGAEITFLRYHCAPPDPDIS